MPPDWAAGRRLGFDIRVWPVVRTGREGRRAKLHELDAFLHESGSHPDGGMEEAGRSREAVYRDWLAARLGSAADLVECRLAKFRRVKLQPKDGVTEGPDATLHGELAIRDPEKFIEKLAGGVGRRKAYGFGMLILRPPGSPVRDG
jgi:CRISPR system Cascade subunit CasE